MSLGFPWTVSNTLAFGNLSNIIVTPNFIMNKTYYIELNIHKDTIASSSKFPYSFLYLDFMLIF